MQNVFVLSLIIMVFTTTLTIDYNMLIAMCVVTILGTDYKEYVCIAHQYTAGITEWRTSIVNALYTFLTLHRLSLGLHLM